MYSGWGKTTLKHEIGLWQLIRTRGIIHGTKPKHSSNVRRFSLKRPLCRLKTLLSGGRKKIKNPTGTKTKTIIRFALKKTVPLTNLVRKSDKNKHHASHMNEEIEFHMLHIPSKPPQFWSADFLQNDPLFTSNAGFNLIEGSSNETLVLETLFSKNFIAMGVMGRICNASHASTKRGNRSAVPLMESRFRAFSCVREYRCLVSPN